jgi:hypothetical protein
MVCLLSPSYATSEFCGEEFNGFNERVQQYIEDAKPKEPPPQPPGGVSVSPGVLTGE